MKFKATVIPSGNACAVEVPAEVAVAVALGPEARPAILIVINGHAWRSRLALMRGMRLVGISAANARAAGVSQGEEIEVTVQRDEQPRTVATPPDLAAALAENLAAQAAFEKLPFGLKRKHVASLEDARTSEVRQRRLDKLVAGLQQ